MFSFSCTTFESLRRNAKTLDKITSKKIEEISQDYRLNQEKKAKLIIEFMRIKKSYKDNKLWTKEDIRFFRHALEKRAKEAREGMNH